MSRLSEGLAGLPAVVIASTAATTLNLNPQDHAGRLVVQNGVVATSAKTFQLPKSTGGGDVYEIVNNAVQTQSLVVAALGADTMTGTAFVRGETATATDVFHTTATSDKYTFNITTTGGLRGDRIQCIDYKAGEWLVYVEGNGSGTLATGFAAT
jgi:hypothetical protein